MLDLIRNRRSIRQFSSESVDDDAVNQIIEMGTWAPSGLNNQPWKFVVVQDFETRKHLSGSHPLFPCPSECPRLHRRFSGQPTRAMTG